MDERSEERRCLALRQVMTRGLGSVTNQYMEAHESIKRFAVPGDISRYHEIYDVSAQDFRDVMSNSPQEENDRESLKGLRYLFSRLFVARQVVLCDLLAVSPDSKINDLHKWSTISREVSGLISILQNCAGALRTILAEEDERQWGESARQGRLPEPGLGSEDTTPAIPPTPGKERVLAQMRRLDSMSQGIRTLHAKVHILRDEANSLFEATENSSDLSAILSRQYETIGVDLRRMFDEL